MFRSRRPLDSAVHVEEKQAFGRGWSHADRTTAEGFPELGFGRLATRIGLHRSRDPANESAGESFRFEVGEDERAFPSDPDPVDAQPTSDALDSEGREVVLAAKEPGRFPQPLHRRLAGEVVPVPPHPCVTGIEPVLDRNAGAQPCVVHPAFHHPAHPLRRDRCVERDDIGDCADASVRSASDRKAGRPGVRNRPDPLQAADQVSLDRVDIGLSRVSVIRGPPIGETRRDPQNQPSVWRPIPGGMV